MIGKMSVRLTILAVAGCLAAFGCAVVVGCDGKTQQKTGPDWQPPMRLSVAAASNLQFTLNQIEIAFERQHPDIDVVVTYGSSGNFFAQLSQ